MQEVREFRYHFSPQEVIEALKIANPTNIGLQALPEGARLEIGKYGAMISHSKTMTNGQQTKGGEG